ncbi:EmrB/QacA subfamily drug resistance transporter [Chitinivorax tropicus]|uniref:EmrB/QacA subfamily drug resistance transporter n=1 Tax=Chitinivorax tropicus TaxID=714531 RepID=A0A840MM79_9PROT|nr:MFS transporter [Chitinivorax tropicus]MBB5018027.1 EmrB/QacA subfamily drug resistance transporter [Chitinivorax tropicus]
MPTTAFPPSRRILAGLSLAVLLPSLSVSIVNTGLPTLMQVFSTPFSAVQWVILGYLLAMTALITSTGYLGDRLGRKRILLIGIALFCIASLLATGAQDITMLVMARIGQGLGAAAMTTLAMACVGEVIPKAKSGGALGLLGTMSAIGTTLGPALGGILIDTMGWQAMFWVPIPLAVLAWVLISRYLPGQTDLSRQPTSNLDIPGMCWLMTTLLFYTLALTLERGHYGWLNGSLLMLALISLAVLIAIERQAANPLLAVHLFQDPQFSSGLIASVAATTVVMAALVVGPFYLGRFFDLNSTQVGLVVSIGPAFATLTSFPAGRLVDRIGSARTITQGLSAMLVASALLVCIPASWRVLGYAIPLALLTTGYATFQTANNTAVLAHSQGGQRGLISGMLNLARNLGLITGASLMGATFAWVVNITGQQHAPTAARYGMQVTFAVATVLVLIALVSQMRVKHASPAKSSQENSSPHQAAIHQAANRHASDDPY